MSDGCHVTIIFVSQFWPRDVDVLRNWYSSRVLCCFQRTLVGFAESACTAFSRQGQVKQPRI